MKEINNTEYTTYTRLANILIVIGILLAIDTIFNLQVIYKLWPLLLTILGVGFIGTYTIRQQRAYGAFLAIGEYCIFFSALALLFNFTSWTVLSSIWPIFITFLGIVLFTLYHFKRKRLLLFLSVIVLLLSLYFFIIFSYNYNLWWVIFIITGISILISKES